MADGRNDRNENNKQLPIRSDVDSEFDLWMKDGDLNSFGESGEVESKWSKYETIRCLDLMKEVRLCLCRFFDIKMDFLCASLLLKVS